MHDTCRTNGGSRLWKFSTACPHTDTRSAARCCHILGFQTAVSCQRHTNYFFELSGKIHLNLSHLQLCIYLHTLKNTCRLFSISHEKQCTQWWWYTFFFFFLNSSNVTFQNGNYSSIKLFQIKLCCIAIMNLPQRRLTSFTAEITSAQEAGTAGLSDVHFPQMSISSSSLSCSNCRMAALKPALAQCADAQMGRQTASSWNNTEDRKTPASVRCLDQSGTVPVLLA